MTRVASMAVLAGFLATVVSAHPQVPQVTSGRQSTGDRAMSPAVVASWIANGPLNGTLELDLLILWRGAPGWFLKGDGHGSRAGGGGNGAGTVTSTLRYGGLSLSASFNAATRVAIVDGHELRLGDNNVVLVDDVDQPGGLKIVGPGNKAVVGFDGKPERETVMRRDRKPVKKFELRAVKNGETIGAWSAPSDGVLVGRVL